MKRYINLSLVLLLGFLLGIHEGKIALWRSDDPEPIQVFPYSAKLLPKEDQKRLSEGVRFESMEELKEFVADYLS